MSLGLAPRKSQTVHSFFQPQPSKNKDPSRDLAKRRKMTAKNINFSKAKQCKDGIRGSPHRSRRDQARRRSSVLPSHVCPNFPKPKRTAKKTPNPPKLAQP
ncbi:hypothetical protein GEV33_007568 [Tenebrio molitor]|uniref:Uncharacterized protein n=1 Tax=Tenebrio molitor TaxID=7067 RepID=A0A8J6HKE4_TENMO|nr:hypothetical protein GEV33_007568 [Tenebrio molitor]